MKREVKIREFIIEGAILSIEASAVLLFFQRTILLTTSLLVLSVYCFEYRYNRDDKIYFVIALFVGPISEIGAVLQGAWKYQVTDFLLMPLWLPLAWGIVVIAIRRIANLIIDKR